MTGYDIYNRVCALLGYSTQEDNCTDSTTERMTDIINQIATDLKTDSINSLNEKIKTDTKKAEAMIYGCAMMLAVATGDAGHARIFADLYNCKRSAALCSSDKREDCLPSPSGGGV